MKGFRLLSLCILVMILFASWGPAPVTAAPPDSVQQTSTATLTINNKTGVDIEVNISGPRSYTWTVKAGKWSYDIERGKYKIGYTACGKKFKGTLNVTSGRSKLTIAACPMVKVVLFNLTGQNISLTLVGPARYNFTLIPGVNRFKIIKGTYKYTFYACGDTVSANIKFKNEWKYAIVCTR